MNRRENIQSQELMRISRELFRPLLDRVFDAIVMLDTKGRIVEVNKTACRLLGYTKKELLKLSFKDIHPESEIKKIQRAIKRTLRRSPDYMGEVSFIGKTGKIMQTESGGVSLKLAGKTYVIGCFRDITSRKKDRQRLEESEERWRLLVQNVPDVIMTVTRDGTLTAINHTVSGIRMEDAIGTKIYRYMDPQYTSMIKKTLNRVFRTGKPDRFHVLGTGPRGPKSAWYETRALPLRKGGKIIAVTLIGTDITERKRAEERSKRDKEEIEKLVQQRTEELFKAQRELEDAKRLSEIGALATTIAHELRNPLATILTASYNIRSKSQNPLLHRNIKNIEKKVLESNQIINNLLFYSRIRKPRYRRINLHRIMEESIQFVKERFPFKNVVINPKCPSPEKTFIEADSLQITEIFNNILNNAFESITGKEGEIGISCTTDRNLIRISFTDNGSGIRKEDLEKVFEPFFTRKPKGIGLGLPVCNQLVSLHGGLIDISSKTGQGTRVTVSLPIRRKPRKK